MEDQTITVIDMHKLKSLLSITGLSNRRSGATSINMESSRSHSVFTCVVESRGKVIRFRIKRVYSQAVFCMVYMKMSC